MALMRKKSRTSGEIPTASMADIAFLLLIFFLVTTVFDEDQGLPIVLPEQESTVEVSQTNILHIMVQPDGLVVLKRGESQAEQTVRPADLTNIWRTEFAQNDKLIAAVKTSPDAPYKYMVDVLDALHLAQADKISLQLLE